jgi:hypothetical protein
MRNLARNRYAKTRARAAAGAALLDRVVPGWWRRVRIRKLDISDDCNCVTGQLFGTYTKGLIELELGTDEAKDYGFENQIGSAGYWILTDAWREELRARRYGYRVTG